jgi:hypothetical protein
MHEHAEETKENKQTNASVYIWSTSLTSRKTFSTVFLLYKMVVTSLSPIMYSFWMVWSYIFLPPISIPNAVFWIKVSKICCQYMIFYIQHFISYGKSGWYPFLIIEIRFAWWYHFTRWSINPVQSSLDISDKINYLKESDGYIGIQ